MASLTDEDSIDENIMNAAMLDNVIQAHVESGGVMPPEDVVKVLKTFASNETETKPYTKNLRSRSADDVKALAVSLKLKEALKLSNELLGEDDSDIISQRVSEMDLNRLSDVMIKSTNLVAAERELYSFRKSTSPPWVSGFIHFVDSLVEGLSPTSDSIKTRMDVFRYVRDVVSKSLNVQLFPFGSFASNTFLPDSNINTTAFVSKNEDDSWFVRLNEAICLSIFGKADLGSIPSFTISNVSFVNGEYIKMIKSSINKIAVDISVNQITALYTEALINNIDIFIGKDNLFKRSIILIKSWCYYESSKYTNGSGPVIGNGDSRLCLNSLIVMIIWVFNSIGKDIDHPIQTLGHFLKIFSSFDWNSYALTTTGPVNANDASYVVNPSDGELFIPNEIFSDVLSRKDENTSLCFSTAVNQLANPPTHQPVELTEGSLSLSSSLQSTNEIEVQAQEVVPNVNKWVLKTAFPRGENSVYIQNYISVLDPLDKYHNCTEKIDFMGYEVYLLIFNYY